MCNCAIPTLITNHGYHWLLSSILARCKVHDRCYCDRCIECVGTNACYILRSRSSAERRWVPPVLPWTDLCVLLKAVQDVCCSAASPFGFTPHITVRFSLRSKYILFENILITSMLHPHSLNTARDSTSLELHLTDYLYVRLTWFLIHRHCWCFC